MSIDYGMGKTNLDHETGIRYGVVSMNSLNSWVYEEFMAHGESLTMREIEEDFRAENPDAGDDAVADYLSEVQIEEENFRLERDGMILELSHLGGAPIIFVVKSPRVVSVGSLCSPCCPGAADLDSDEKTDVSDMHPDIRANMTGHLAYDVPAEWYGQD